MRVLIAVRTSEGAAIAVVIIAATFATRAAVV
jgi:phosphatidylserine decarboxylase